LQPLFDCGPVMIATNGGEGGAGLVADAFFLGGLGV
jgi:hypothetical protein